MRYKKKKIFEKKINSLNILICISYFWTSSLLSFSYLIIKKSIARQKQLDGESCATHAKAIFHKQRKWPTILGHSRGYMDFRYLSKQTNVLFILFSSVSHTHLVRVSHLRTYILIQTCIHTWLFLCDSVRKYSHVRKIFFFFLVIFVSYSLYKI